MKILIAVPSMDQVPVQFCQSLAVMNKVGDECGIAFQVGSLIYTSRNKLAMLAIEKEADYVLWLDSDMVFPPDVLERLLKVKDRGDIITGVYYRRVEPYHPVLFKSLEISDDECHFEDERDIKKEPFEVAACGFGCVLTPTNVLIDVLAKFGDLFSPISGMGEDLAFCWRARQCGYNIIADPTFYLGHIGHYTVDKGFYEAFAKAKGENNGSKNKASVQDKRNKRYG